MISVKITILKTDDKFREVLQQEGFTPNEITVYVALLKIGPANAAEVARSSDMDKTSAYRAAEKLLKRGVIRRTGKNYDQKLYIEDPETVARKLEQKRHKLDENIQSVKEFMSELPIDLSSKYLSSKITVYEDENAIYRLVEDTHAHADGIIRLTQPSGDIGFNWPSEPEWLRYIKNRVRLGIQNRTLMDRALKPDKLIRTEPKWLKEVRYLPTGYNMKTGLHIYGNRLSFYNTGSMHPIAVIIDDQSITELMRTFFDIVWAQAYPET